MLNEGEIIVLNGVCFINRDAKLVAATKEERRVRGEWMTTRMTRMRAKQAGSTQRFIGWSRRVFVPLVVSKLVVSKKSLHFVHCLQNYQQ